MIFIKRNAIVKNNKTGSGVTSGEKLTIMKYSPGNRTYACVKSNNTLVTLYEEDLTIEPIEKSTISDEIESIAKEIKDLNEKMNTLKGYIDFLEKNNIKEFDEYQYKIFTVLQTINKDMSDIEKSMIIADIIK